MVHFKVQWGLALKKVFLEKRTKDHDQYQSGGAEMLLKVGEKRLEGILNTCLENLRHLIDGSEVRPHQIRTNPTGGNDHEAKRQVKALRNAVLDIVGGALAQALGIPPEGQQRYMELWKPRNNQFLQQIDGLYRAAIGDSQEALRIFEELVTSEQLLMGKSFQPLGRMPEVVKGPSRPNRGVPSSEQEHLSTPGIAGVTEHTHVRMGFRPKVPRYEQWGLNL